MVRGQFHRSEVNMDVNRAVDRCLRPCNGPQDEGGTTRSIASTHGKDTVLSHTLAQHGSPNWG